MKGLAAPRRELEVSMPPNVPYPPSHTRAGTVGRAPSDIMDGPLRTTVPWAAGAVVSAEQHSQWHGGTLSRAPSRAASFKSRRSSCAIMGLIAQLKGIAGGGGSPARAYVHLYRYTCFLVFLCQKPVFSNVIIWISGTNLAQRCAGHPGAT